MESLGPGELKHGTTQVFLLLFFITYRLISGNPLGIHRPGETQAWNQPGWPTGALKHGVPGATIKVRLAKCVIWEYG